MSNTRAPYRLPTEPEPDVQAAASPALAEQQTQALLEQSRARLNAMLESIGDAFFAVDHEWRITYANSKAAAFVDAALDASLGRPLLEVAPELAESELLPHYLKAMAT